MDLCCLRSSAVVSGDVAMPFATMTPAAGGAALSPPGAEDVAGLHSSSAAEAQWLQARGRQLPVVSACSWTYHTPLHSLKTENNS